MIATTQDFSYFVIKAVSKTEGEMGSYWQTVEDLIADMVAFINENKGDFTAWMNARKKNLKHGEILKRGLFDLVQFYQRTFWHRLILEARCY